MFPTNPLGIAKTKLLPADNRIKKPDLGGESRENLLITRLKTEGELRYFSNNVRSEPEELQKIKPGFCGPWYPQKIHLVFLTFLN